MNSRYLKIPRGILISGILMILMGLFNIFNILRFAIFNPNLSFGWDDFLISRGIGLILHILTIVSGIGILKFKNWSRIVAIVVFIILGIIHMLILLDCLTSNSFDFWSLSVSIQLFISVCLIIFFTHSSTRSIFKR